MCGLTCQNLNFVTELLPQFTTDDCTGLLQVSTYHECTTPDLDTRLKVSSKYSQVFNKWAPWLMGDQNLDTGFKNLMNLVELEFVYQMELDFQKNT